jgi:hypothetical protein
MEFEVEWDQEHELALVKHVSLVLDSKAAVQGWRERLFAKLEAIRSMRGKKFPIVVCIDNFMIRPKVADAYGRVVREMLERFASGVARYGEPSTVKQIIAVEAMKEGFRANLFETFEQAIAFFGGPQSSSPPTSRSLRAVVDAGNSPPTSRALRAIVESSSTPPTSRSLRAPAAGAAEPPPRSLVPRQGFKSVASLPAKQAAASAEEPIGPTSRRPDRITIR